MSRSGRLLALAVGIVDAVDRDVGFEELLKGHFCTLVVWWRHVPEFACTRSYHGYARNTFNAGQEVFDPYIHVIRVVQRIILISELISAPKEDDLNVVQIEEVLQIVLVVVDASNRFVGHVAQCGSVGAFDVNAKVVSQFGPKKERSDR